MHSAIKTNTQMINDIRRTQSILIVVKLFDLNFPRVFSLQSIGARVAPRLLRLESIREESRLIILIIVKQKLLQHQIKFAICI